MIPYILHVTVITTVCFLFYKLLLQKETFYRLNRWMLMACLGVSFTLPFLPVPQDWSWRYSGFDQPAATVAQSTIVTVRTEAVVPVRQEAAMPVPDLLMKPAETVVPEHPARHANQANAKKKKPALAASPSNFPLVAAVPIKPESVRTPVIQQEKKAGLAMDKVVVVLQWLFYLYLFGVLVFGGNFLLQLAVLLFQSYARPVIRDGRFRIVETSGNRAPCSFGNTIFINPANYDWDTYNQILIHEKVHVSGRHTLDILLAEMAVVLQWFNPFAWLYRREVENNLEFLTDASVLEHQEVERSAYQLSLLRVSAPHLPFSITNNYNQSLLKRRIVMMNSKQSSTHTVWKYFFLIPLLTALVCALNKPAAYGAGIKDRVAANAGGNRTSAGRILPMNRMDPSQLWMKEAAGPATDTGRKPKSAEDSLHRQAKKDAERADRLLDDGNISVAGDAYTLKNDFELDRAQAARNLTITTAMTGQTVTTTQMEAATARAYAQADANAQATTFVRAEPNVSVHAISPDIRIDDFRNGNDTDVLDGSWFATSSSVDSGLNIEFRRQEGENNWNNSVTIFKRDFNPYPGAGAVEFKLVRDAGTVTFKGQFDGEEGFGHFHFAPNETFFTAMKQIGIESIDGRRFAFFNANVKKDYAAAMTKVFPHLSTHELLSLSSTHVDAEFIKSWQASGMEDLDNPRAFIQLKSVHVDKAFVDEMKAAGYDRLTVRDLVSMKSMHIDGAYVRDIRAAGYDHPEPQDLVGLKSMRVDGAYIRSLGRDKGNQPVPLREIITYKSMHIDSGYIASLRAVGYQGLSRNEIAALYSLHVSAEYIKSFQAIGYKAISVQELINLKSWNITPEYVKGFTDAGYKDIQLRQIHNFKIQNITPEYVKSWHDLGYEDIGGNQIASLKSIGITPDFVKEFNKIGFDHIPLNLLNTLKSTGVNAEYVTKMKEKGFVSKDLGKYVRLKNDFN